MFHFVLILSATLLFNVSYIYCGDFFEINGNIYFMSYPHVKNWYEAGRYCTFHGMYLMDLNTETEDNVAIQILNATRNKYNLSSALVWTSGTDLGSEGRYYWETTGFPMLYTKWSDHQPDNAGENEHCIEINMLHYNWNDRPCTNLSSFICQKFKNSNCKNNN